MRQDDFAKVRELRREQAESPLAGLGLLEVEQCLD